MKVLVLNAGDEHTLGWSYKRAFEACGCSVELIDPGELLGASALWSNRLTRRLLERPLISELGKKILPQLVSLKPDLIWVGKGDWALPELWQACRHAMPSTVLVCYNPDDPITTFSRGGNRPWVTQSISSFDLFCTYKQDLLPKLEAFGARQVLHLPFAWDPAVHPPQRSTEEFDYDVVFVGNGDRHRWEWLRDIIVQPSMQGVRFGIYGHWKGVNTDSLGPLVYKRQALYGTDMARLIARSKIALNILRLQNEGSHNMRTFEIPGSGGVMASQWSKEQVSFFPDGEAAVYFHSPAEAAARMSSLLEDAAQLRLMRSNSISCVSRHTYEQRANFLLQAVDAIKTNTTEKSRHRFEKI